MPKALYILSAHALDLIYGPPEQERIAHLVDLVGPPQTAESIAENLDLLAEVEVILSGWGAPRLDEAFLAAAPDLRAFLYGAGSVRGFITDAFWERDIRLSSAYAANAVPVAEFAASAIFLSLKRFWHLTHAVKAGGAYPAPAERQSVPGAFGSTVGLVSLGMVGRLVRHRLQTSDVRVIAYDPYITPEEATILDVELVSLPDLFRQADVVSLHTPWLPETEGLIDGELLASLKAGATFINTARGAVVREAEMIRVLQERPDLWAVLDVTHPEPPVPGSPLYRLPNVLLTPHIAGSQAQECRRLGQYMLAELRRYLEGEPLRWEITRERVALLA